MFKIDPIEKFQNSSEPCNIQLIKLTKKQCKRKEKKIQYKNKQIILTNDLIKLKLTEANIIKKSQLKNSLIYIFC